MCVCVCVPFFFSIIFRFFSLDYYRPFYNADFFPFSFKCLAYFSNDSLLIRLLIVWNVFKNWLLDYDFFLFACFHSEALFFLKSIKVFKWWNTVGILYVAFLQFHFLSLDSVFFFTFAIADSKCEKKCSQFNPFIFQSQVICLHTQTPLSKHKIIHKTNTHTRIHGRASKMTWKWN